jgi:hypothetical protein
MRVAIAFIPEANRDARPAIADCVAHARRSRGAQARAREQKQHTGIGPRGASQWRQFRKLARRKLLKAVGWGRDIAAESVEGRDLYMYELTVLGRRAAAAITPNAELAATQAALIDYWNQICVGEIERP